MLKADFFQSMGKKLGAEKILQAACFIVIAACVLLSLPAILIPLGLPPEGDAADYRVPLIKWMLRHGQYPNWPWSFVDDYPLFVDLVMAGFYWVSPYLVRIVPILAYIALGIAGGRLAMKLASKNVEVNKNTVFLLGMAWAMCLRPLALQANLIMIDNVASAFFLFTFIFVLDGRVKTAGVFGALALATRYSTWGPMILMPAFLFFSVKEERFGKVVFFCLISGLGALPFMIRNFLVNHHHAFYPVDAPEIFSRVGFESYGRGKKLWHLLILPWDILYTNTFKEGIFDYTVGKLFYLQIAAVLIAGKKTLGSWKRRDVFALLLFIVLFTVIWFFSSQQMRFLVPALLVVNMVMLYSLLQSKHRWLLAFVTLFGVFSVLSVQKDSVLLALGKTQSIFEPARKAAELCFSRSGVGSDPIGLTTRQGFIGFFDNDFYYMNGHPFSAVPETPIAVNWIYHLSPQEGYEPWPKENPCLMKRITP